MSSDTERPTSRSRQRSTVPEALTRDAIADVALRLMDEHGVDAVSMRRLAGELGVSAQALYWHFPNRDTLLRAVVDHAAAELRSVTLGRGSPRQRLERYLRELRRHWKRHPSAITLGRQYFPTAAGDVHRQGTELFEQLGFAGADAIERHRSLVWIVLGFVFVEHSVAASQHHTPLDAQRSAYDVRLPGAEADQPGHHLDIDRLFEDTLAIALDGLVAALPVP